MEPVYNTRCYGWVKIGEIRPNSDRVGRPADAAPLSSASSWSVTLVSIAKLPPG